MFCCGGGVTGNRLRKSAQLLYGGVFVGPSRTTELLVGLSRRGFLMWSGYVVYMGLDKLQRLSVGVADYYFPRTILVTTLLACLELVHRVEQLRRQSRQIRSLGVGMTGCSASRRQLSRNDDKATF